MRWSVVVPSNRPERLKTFKRAWGPRLDQHDAELFVVLDEPPWEGIPEWIPRRTDMVRSWGIYLAWESGSDYIVSLDDDVFPDSAFDLFEEYERGFARTFPLAPYLSVGGLTSSPHEMRGFPYEHRAAEVGIQYGGWTGVLDYDAVTQISYAPGHETFLPAVMPVPRGVALTTCAMNFAFRHDLAPLAWQLPLLDGRYNRMGDIWSGLFQKRALDAAGLVMLLNGRATVWHERASDPWQNLAREAPGMSLNESLWRALDGQDAQAYDRDARLAWEQTTDSAARYFAGYDLDYAAHFTRCRDQWLALFDLDEWSRDKDKSGVPRSPSAL